MGIVQANREAASFHLSGEIEHAVNVLGSASGQYTNTWGAVSSTNGGTGNTATASLTVATPPSASKAFGATTIPLNGTTSLTVTITNNNSNLALTGLSFTDNLPAGLTVAAGGNNNTCGGSITGATAGSGSFSLSGGSLAASGSCSVDVNVTGTAAGVKNNSTAASSNETGSGTPGSASITVVAPPAISKAFGASSIPLNGSTTLTVTISNPNATLGLTGLSFGDCFPAGLSVVSSNSNTCGGTLGASGGSTGVSLTGGSVGSGTSCSISVNVTGTTAGVKSNTTGSVSSTEGGAGTTSNTASLTVVAPPSIAKAFGAANISVGGTTSLTLTITNPNSSTGLNGVAVTDNFPAGLVVAATPNAGNTCGGSVTGTTSGSTGISLSGGSIAGGASCAVSVNVTATTAGPKTNTPGNVTSTEGGTGNFGSATIGAGDFTILVSPTSQTIPAGHMAVFTLTLDTTTGFQGTINLTCSGGPSNSTCTVIPSSVTLTSSAVMAKVTVDLAVPKGASRGMSTVTFTGTSGALTHSTTAKLTAK